MKPTAGTARRSFDAEGVHSGLLNGRDWREADRLRRRPLLARCVRALGCSRPPVRLTPTSLATKGVIATTVTTVAIPAA